MKIHQVTKSTPLFKSLEAGDVFRSPAGFFIRIDNPEAGGPWTNNAVRLSNGELYDFNSEDEVKLLPNAALFPHGAPNENA